MFKKKVALFDLDGTIRKTKSGKTFITDPMDQEPIVPAIFALNALRARGYFLVGITNQGGVPQHKSIHECMMEQLITLQMLNLDLLLFAPSKGYACYELMAKDREYGITRNTSKDPVFRKPHPGMLLRAVEHFAMELGMHGQDMVSKEGIMKYEKRKFEDHFTDIFYTGDRPEDEKAAELIGLKFLTIKQFHNYKGV